MANRATTTRQPAEKRPAGKQPGKTSPARRSRGEPSPASPPQPDGRTQEEIRLGLFKKVVDLGLAWRDCENAACRRARECTDPAPCTERYREAIVTWLREVIVPDLRRMRAAGLVPGDTRTPAGRAAVMRVLRDAPAPLGKGSGAEP